MTEIIYVVVDGQYSDYHIEALFSERGPAEQLVNRHNPKGYDSGFRIEEHLLDPPLAMRTDGLNRYVVVMGKNGDEAYADQRWHAPDALYVRRGYWHGIMGEWLHITVKAKDEKHAIKIANEKRGQLIATERWDSLKRYRDALLSLHTMNS